MKLIKLIVASLLLCSTSYGMDGIQDEINSAIDNIKDGKTEVAKQQLLALEPKVVLPIDVLLVQSGLADFDLQDGNGSKAIARLEKVLTLDVDNSIKFQMEARIAFIYNSTGQRAKARETYESLLKREELLPVQRYQLFKGIAQSYEDEGKYDLALDSIDRFSSIEKPKVQDTLLYKIDRSVIWAHSGEIEGAIADLKKIEALDPNDFDVKSRDFASIVQKKGLAQWEIANILLSQKKTLDALSIYKEIENSPFAPKYIREAASKKVNELSIPKGEATRPPK